MDYEDDSYLQGDTYKLCLDNVMVIIQAVRTLGLLYDHESQISFQSKLFTNIKVKELRASAMCFDE